MSKPFIPISTAKLEWLNGWPCSATIPILNKTVKEALNFSKKNFLEANDLINRWRTLPNDKSCIFNIAEADFGIGLNFLLIWQEWLTYAPENASLHFIASESQPLKLDDLKKCLALWPQLSELSIQLVNSYPVLTPGYHQLSFDNGRVKLILMLGNTVECFEQLLICGESKLEAQLRSAYIDVWYFNKQQLWPQDFLKMVALLSKQSTSISGISKKAFTDLGYIMEKKSASAPDCFRFKSMSDIKLKTAATPWHSNNVLKPKTPSAIIIGAGLAGCFMANSLVKRGWSVTLLEEHSIPGHGASANQQALLFPKLSAYSSPLSELMLAAFLYAYTSYKDLLTQHKLGELNGILLMAHNEREQKVQQSLVHWLYHYPELARLVDKELASQLVGLTLDKPGLFIPKSGWMNAAKLCQVLIQSKDINLRIQTKVSALHYDDGQWIVNEHKAPVLILANGAQLATFKQSAHLAIQPVRGQMTRIKSTSESNKLLIPLCGQSHVSPSLNGLHLIGATFEVGKDNLQGQKLDDEKNKHALKLLAAKTQWSEEVVEHWVGIRAATLDYLPLVGPVPINTEFNIAYAQLASDAKRWINTTQSYYPGLYVCAGFGSRGLTTIPLCCEWLASSINNEISCLPRNLIQALAPARFLKQNIIRQTK